MHTTPVYALAQIDAIRRAIQNNLANGDGKEIVQTDASPPDRGEDTVLSIADFKIRLADTESGRNSASMLINKMYSWRGYTGEHVIQEGPNRITLTAYMRDALIGTVTLAIDSPGGLLADEIFGDELNRHRGQGHKLCELTKLAFDPSIRSQFALASLFHICFIYARRMHGCTDVFIEVNPRHRTYYERMLGFRQLGGLRSNPRVNAPAYLLWADIEFIEEQIHKYGGGSDRVEKVRSLYPYFFSVREEAGITERLRTMS